MGKVTLVKNAGKNWPVGNKDFLKKYNPFL